MSPKFPAKRLGPFAALVLLPLVALGSLRYRPRSGDTVKLPVVEVQTGDLLSAVTATGTVEAHRTVDIKYDTQSLVTELDVQEGDRIRVNQTLATSVTRISAMMGRKSISTGDPSDKSDRDVLEAVIELDDNSRPLPIGLRVTVQFLSDDRRK